MRARRRNIDVDAADSSHLGLTIFERGDTLAFYHAFDRHQHLHAMADRKDRFTCIVEVFDDLLHVLIDTDIFGTTPTRDIDGVVIFGPHVCKSRVEGLEMPWLF